MIAQNANISFVLEPSSDVLPSGTSTQRFSVFIRKSDLQFVLTAVKWLTGRKMMLLSCLNLISRRHVNTSRRWWCVRCSKKANKNENNSPTTADRQRLSVFFSLRRVSFSTNYPHQPQTSPIHKVQQWIYMNRNHERDITLINQFESFSLSAS